MAASLTCDSLSLILGDTPVLRDVSLEFEAGRSVAIVGKSGAGKTSLLHCLSGLRSPSSGTVTLADNDVYALSEFQRADLRLRNCGFVFQRADLVSELTLLENIALPLEFQGRRRREAMLRAEELVVTLGLEECAGRRPDRVSGGQRQRAAVGRALASYPRVVFADEPTGALDSENAEAVLTLLLQHSCTAGATLIMVTHDESSAARCDRVIRMRDGRICEDSGEGLVVIDAQVATPAAVES